MSSLPLTDTVNLGQQCSLLSLKKYSVAAMLSKCSIPSIHSSMHEIKYNIWETFVEKLVIFCVLLSHLYVYNFFSDLLCSFIFYVFRVDFC